MTFCVDNLKKIVLTDWQMKTIRVYVVKWCNLLNHAANWLMSFTNKLSEIIIKAGCVIVLL